MTGAQPTTSMPVEAKAITIQAQVCDLCGLRLPKRIYKTEYNGTPRHFCCAGCRQVFLLLCESGLIDGDFKSSEIYQTSLRLGIISNPEEDTTALFTPSAEDLKGTQELVLHLNGMWCSACSWLIEKTVIAEPGVVHARVIYASDTAKIHYRPEQISAERIASVIDKLGYKAAPREAATAAHAAERNSLLLKMGLALFIMMNVMFFTYVIYVGYFQELAPEIQRLVPFVLLLLALPSVFWCGQPIHQKAWRSLLSRAPTMELLLSLGIFAAFFYSVYALFRSFDHFYFDTACSLVALVLVGKFIESSAKQKASANIHRLYEMMPNKVRLVAPDGHRLVAIEKLQAGDHFLVKAGEKIPADGRIVEGRAIVDESLLTGESKPIEKRCGEMVTGSTMLVNGLIEVEALRIGEQTVLANIIKMVETALTAKSPLERLVDRLTRVFIPLVLSLATAAAIFLILSGAGLETALLRAITVLVIACPCALGMATPLAIAAGIGHAARRGILTRDGSALQLAGKATTVVFDKTGTLTEGKFTVLSFNSSGDDEDEALRLVGSLEQASNHPLAVAIVETCKEKRLELYETKELQIVEGMGLAGTVMVAETSKRVVAGNEAFVRQQGFVIPPEKREWVEREAERGRTVVFFGIDGRMSAGYFVLGDSMKPNVQQVVADLHELGASVQLLSGDAKLTTAAVAQQAGIADFTAQALPQDKVAAIRKLQSCNQVVAMVGDGVNDAPALAQADVGIAMGSGTEIAIAAGAITMMRDDLALVPQAIQLSRRTVRTIKQNLTWAFFYNTIGIVIAILGWLNPLMAVSAMLVSSLSVVGNSMRLHEGKGKTLEKFLEILVPWREPEGKQNFAK